MKKRTEALGLKGIYSQRSSVALATALLSFAATWLTPTKAQASTFAYEGFNYEPAAIEDSFLNGLNGGIGWLPYKQESPSATHFGTTGISYNDRFGNQLLTSGRSGALTNEVGEHGSFRFINTSDPKFPVSTIPARDPNLGSPGSQTQPGIGVDGTTIWLGFLMSVPTTTKEDWSEKYAGLSLFYDDYIRGVGTGPFPSSRSNERLFIGAPFGETDRPLNFGIDHPGAKSPIFTDDTFSGATAFLTARIDFGSGASDRVRLWVNPTLGDDPSFAIIPDVDYVMPFDLSVNRIGILGNSPFKNPNLIEYDEIRFGTSFIDVAPTKVPEPTTQFWSIALLPGLFALLRRQQHKSQASS